MRLNVLLPILPLTLLAACQVPGRNTFAAPAVAPDTASVTATQAFKDRVPLITILPGTTDFAGPVASAVRQALAIKPASATPDASAADLTALSGTASAVAKAIIADGVAASNVSLTAKSAGLDAYVLVYVK
jgi:hypothetical protein